VKKNSLIFSILLVSSIVLALSFLGCGGGGGSASSSSASGSTAAGSGTVALYIADAPSDEYDSVILYVKKVMLLPPDSEPNRKIATVFQSTDPDGYPVDLLKYRFQDFFLALNKHVPAGYYSKIRLMVARVEGVGGPCDDNIKLPSGKVDLVLKEKVYVRSGRPLAIRLDVDVDKSFDLHVAGNSGMCIFRPVVFVEATYHLKFFKCPRLVKGTIKKRTYEDGVLSGFILALDLNRGTVEVGISDSTHILDENGMEIGPDALSKGQFIHLKGPMTEYGYIEALFVVIGEKILDITGTAVSEVDADDLFDMQLDPNQALKGNIIPVLVDEALIVSGCDEITDSSVIVPWARTDVIGKYDTIKANLKATAVVVGAPRIDGELVSIASLASGYDLGIIPTDATVPVSVFVADEASIYLGRDGNVTIKQLEDRIACVDPIYVSVKLHPDTTDLEARRVMVRADRVTGVVQFIGSGGEIDIEDDDGNIVPIQLQDSTKIIHHGDYGDEHVAEGAIEKGDRLTVFGLYRCPNADLLAFVIFLQPKDVPIYQLPEIITENDAVYMLPAGIYNRGLTVNGNNFSLSGNKVAACGSANQTVLLGDVVINGNNATFKNITFNGNVIKNGNGTRFIDCCF
jgi:hypothetical protein